jgi:hypothetical protein
MSNDPHNPFETFTPITVKVSNFTDYYQAVGEMGGYLAAPFLQDVQDVMENARNGLQHISYGTDNLPMSFLEGAQVALALEQNLAYFQAFYSDLVTGLTCIADAAEVVGNLYHNTDIISSTLADFGPAQSDLLGSQATVDNVDWAFADYGAATPTMDAWVHTAKDGAVADGAGGPSGPMSASGDISKATGYSHDQSPDGRYQVQTYTFPDGSRMQVFREPDGTQVIMYGPDGKVIGGNSDLTTDNPDGTYTVTRTQQTGNDQSGTRVTVEITYNTDGSETINTQTSYWDPTLKEQGNPDTVSSADHPAVTTDDIQHIAAPQGPTRPPGDYQGPVQQEING